MSKKKKTEAAKPTTFDPQEHPALCELNLEFADDVDGSTVAFTEEAAGEELMADADSKAEIDLGDSELADFESAEIEDVEVLTEEQTRSIIESVLFSTDKPQSLAQIKQAFKGTNIKSKELREAIHKLIQEYEDSNRGFAVHEVAGGFQLRTKPENLKYLRQSVKPRAFKLSGPALEVLSIVAYKQPVTKAQIDEIRGVECGHLLRALMEKSLVNFGERSELPGKPMFYETTRKFLEIFGLRNLQELPSLAEIDQLIPEGIGDEPEKEKLSDLTGQLSQSVGDTYSVGEEELLKISDELDQITTSSEFFEQEKQRMRERRDSERAQSIREAILVGEPVDDKDRRWLERYESAQVEAAQSAKEVEFVTEEATSEEPTTALMEDLPEVVDDPVGR